MNALLLAAESAASSGPWMLRNAWLIPFVPAVSFVLLAAVIGAIVLARKD